MNNKNNKESKKNKNKNINKVRCNSINEEM